MHYRAAETADGGLAALLPNLKLLNLYGNKLSAWEDVSH